MDTHAHRHAPLSSAERRLCFQQATPENPQPNVKLNEQQKKSKENAEKIAGFRKQLQSLAAAVQGTLTMTPEEQKKAAEEQKNVVSALTSSFDALRRDAPELVTSLLGTMTVEDFRTILTSLASSQTARETFVRLFAQLSTVEQLRNFVESGDYSAEGVEKLIQGTIIQPLIKVGQENGWSLANERMGGMLFSVVRNYVANLLVTIAPSMDLGQLREIGRGMYQRMMAEAWEKKRARRPDLPAITAQDEQRYQECFDTWADKKREAAVNQQRFTVPMPKFDNVLTHATRAGGDVVAGETRMKQYLALLGGTSSQETDKKQQEADEKDLKNSTLIENIEAIRKPGSVDITAERIVRVRMDGRDVLFRKSGSHFQMKVGVGNWATLKIRNASNQPVDMTSLSLRAHANGATIDAIRVTANGNNDSYTNIGYILQNLGTSTTVIYNAEGSPDFQ